MITMMYDESTTCRQAVEAWDRREPIWTVEMGGLGPGYEQAIQVLVVNLLRDNLDKPLPAEGQWEGWGDDTAHRLNETCHGFSGAQVGAAKSCAARMLTVGYGKALLEVKAIDPDRLIQVSKTWPGEPTTT